MTQEIRRRNEPLLVGGMYGQGTSHYLVTEHLEGFTLPTVHLRRQDAGNWMRWARPCTIRRGAWRYSGTTACTGTLCRGHEEDNMTRATGRLEDAYEILQRSERYILCRSKAANPRHTYATMKLDAQGHVYGIRVHSTFEAAEHEYWELRFPQLRA